MGHISVYRRMLVWAIGTVMIIVGVFDILTVHGMVFIDLFLFIGGWIIVVVNGLSLEQGKNSWKLTEMRLSNILIPIWYWRFAQNAGIRYPRNRNTVLSAEQTCRYDKLVRKLTLF